MVHDEKIPNTQSFATHSESKKLPEALLQITAAWILDWIFPILAPFFIHDIKKRPQERSVVS